MTAVMVEVRLGKKELEQEIEHAKQYRIGLERYRKEEEEKCERLGKKYKKQEHRISTFDSTLMDLIEYLDERIGQTFYVGRTGVLDIQTLMRSVEGNIRVIAKITNSEERAGYDISTLIKSMGENIRLISRITTLVDKASKKGSFYNTVRSYLVGTDDYYKKYGSGRYNEATTFLRSVLPFEVYWEIRKSNRHRGDLSTHLHSYG